MKFQKGSNEEYGSCTSLVGNMSKVSKLNIQDSSNFNRVVDHFSICFKHEEEDLHFNLTAGTIPEAPERYCNDFLEEKSVTITLFLALFDFGVIFVTPQRF